MYSYYLFFLRKGRKCRLSPLLLPPPTPILTPMPISNANHHPTPFPPPSWAYVCSVNVSSTLFHLFFCLMPACHDRTSLPPMHPIYSPPFANSPLPPTASDGYLPRPGQPCLFHSLLYICFLPTAYHYTSLSDCPLPLHPNTRCTPAFT